MKRLYFLAAIALGVLFAAACPQPLPPPQPPQPADVFTGVLFDCHLPVVLAEREAVKPPVRACYLSAGPRACLVGLVGQFNVTSVACLARDVGASANADSVANPADATAKAIADAARTFITEEGMGYR